LTNKIILLTVKYTSLNITLQGINANNITPCNKCFKESKPAVFDGRAANTNLKKHHRLKIQDGVKIGGEIANHYLGKYK